MTRFEFLVDIRERLMREISGIQNAGFSLYWDDTRPNWSTQRSVELLFAAVRKNAEAFGVFVAGRHCDCGRRSHREDYYLYPIAGREIAYREAGFEWADVLDQSERECACPCSDNQDPKKHYVLVDVIYDKSADVVLCKAITSILADIYRAMENAGSKRPRSGIREHLLRAMLTTNDHILPQSLDAFIAEQSKTKATAS